MKLSPGVWIFRDGELTLLGAYFTLYLDGGVRISYQGPAPDADWLFTDGWDGEVEIWVIGRTKTLLCFGMGLFDASVDTGPKPRIRGEIRSTGRWYGPALDNLWDHRR
jgi:hypothetical protein